jgi:5,10-methenyltetrahydrofolate synthetase
MNGFDAQGYRLGYGGGFFDRTLAALRAQGHTVCVIGVAFEFSRLTTIYPQHYDLPMDWIVTETTTYAVRHQCLVAQPAR